MKFNKRFYKNQDSGKRKRSNEKIPKKYLNDKVKGSSKGKKFECFNYGGLGHYTNDYPSPKDIKKSMHATWSGTNSEKRASTTSKDERYDPNDFLTFIASTEYVNDNDCDSDNDDEFIDEQRVEFLNNVVVEHEKLIKSYLKDHDILEAHKNKIDMFNIEKT